MEFSAVPLRRDSRFSMVAKMVCKPRRPDLQVPSEPRRGDTRSPEMSEATLAYGISLTANLSPYSKALGAIVDKIMKDYHCCA